MDLNGLVPERELKDHLFRKEVALEQEAGEGRKVRLKALSNSRAADLGWKPLEELEDVPEVMQFIQKKQLESVERQRRQLDGIGDGNRGARDPWGMFDHIFSITQKVALNPEDRGRLQEAEELAPEDEIPST